MSETVAKERIGEAMDLLEASKGVTDRVQLVGLIDLARDELSRALKEAKERQGVAKKQRAMRGQKNLPLEPQGAVGVNGEGVVLTPADVAPETHPAPVEGPADFLGRDPASPLAEYSLRCPECGSLRYETPEHGVGSVCGLSLVPGGCPGVLVKLHPRIGDTLPTEQALDAAEASF